MRRGGPPPDRTGRDPALKSVGAAERSAGGPRGRRQPSSSAHSLAASTARRHRARDRAGVGVRRGHPARRLVPDGGRGDRRSRGRPRGPARKAAPSAVVSATSRADDRHAEQVGLGLHQERVVRHPAVDTQLFERPAGVGRHGLEQVGRLVGDAVERGAREVGARRPARDRRGRRRGRTGPSAARRARRTPAPPRRRRCRAPTPRALRPPAAVVDRPGARRGATGRRRRPRRPTLRARTASRRPSICHATVVSSPCSLATGSSPVW